MLSADQVETRLAELESIGWTLGLDRMRALCAELGNPQLRYVTVHVVGTNGKTSVARMLEGLLNAAGIRAGSSVSPHLTLWRERITVDGRTLSAEAFVHAAESVFEAVRAVEARLGPEQGRLSQFEVATAIAFVALADAAVEVAVIEAGMGGRLDASNVLQSKLTVLTSIGLDHVDWLGSTEVEIAAEKLAVLNPGSALLVGPVSEPVMAEARQYARQRQGELIAVETSPELDSASLPGRFRRLDLELARKAANYLFAQGLVCPPSKGRPAPFDPDSAAAIAKGIEIPGRLELSAGEPEVVFDVAHNPDGAAALAEALPEVAGSRPIVACLALLADKDANGFIDRLAPQLDAVICSELPATELRGSGRPGASFHPAARLAARCTRLNLQATPVVDPIAALGRAGETALERRALLLVTGSHYLVALARDRRLWQH